MKGRSNLAARRIRRKQERWETIKDWTFWTIIITTLTVTVCVWIQTTCILDMQSDLLRQITQQQMIHNEETKEKTAPELQPEATNDIGNPKRIALIIPPEKSGGQAI